MEQLIVWMVLALIVSGYLAQKHRAHIHTRQALRQRLTSAQWESRHAALQEVLAAFHASADNEYLHLLVSMSRDPHPQVRQETLTVMYRLLEASPLPKYETGESVVIKAWRAQVVDAARPLLDDPAPAIRKRAVDLLRYSEHSWAVDLLLLALEDDHSSVRASAIDILLTRHESRILPPLLQHQDDARVLLALERLCPLVQTVIFAQRYSGAYAAEQTIWNPDVSQLTIPLSGLRHIVIDPQTCQQAHVEVFAEYLHQVLGHEYLKQSVTVQITEHLMAFPLSFYTPFASCRQVDVDIEWLVFGQHLVSGSPAPPMLQNPTLADLQIPLRHITEVTIQTDSYDFYQVEQFLTYVVNYLGQDYLKRCVTASLIGDPQKLHVNLRNTLTQLCRAVSVNEE